jgi:endonuclease-3
MAGPPGALGVDRPGIGRPNRPEAAFDRRPDDSTSYYTAPDRRSGMTGGTYTLLIGLDRPADITVGALGEHRFPAGAYAYTGSAFGSGGFGRVDRHYELAAGERGTRHWHIDYLLGHDDASIRGDVRTPGADVECAVAADLPEAPIAGFGASDCGCRSHLAYDEDGDRLREAANRAHRAADGA